MDNTRKIEFVETIGGELRCEVCGKILAFLDEAVHDENIGIKAHLCVTQHHCGQDVEPPEDIAF